MAMSKEDNGNKLWNGRFSEPTDAFVEKFTASVDFDSRMYRQDIAGSKAHARMLQQAGLTDGGYGLPLGKFIRSRRKTDFFYT